MEKWLVRTRPRQLIFVIIHSVETGSYVEQASLKLTILCLNLLLDCWDCRHASLLVFPFLPFCLLADWFRGKIRENFLRPTETVLPGEICWPALSLPFHLCFSSPSCSPTSPSLPSYTLSPLPLWWLLGKPESRLVSVWWPVNFIWACFLVCWILVQELSPKRFWFWFWFGLGFNFHLALLIMSTNCNAHHNKCVHCLFGHFINPISLAVSCKSHS